MQTTEYGNLIQLTRWRFVNAFLVREDDGFTLVDTMISGSAKGILDAAASYGAPIRRIVLTHAHVDHVGSLDALHALLPEAEVIAPERSVPLLKKDLSLRPDEPQVTPRGGFPGVRTTPTRLVMDGDIICSLQVVAAPGHSPDHVALLDTRDNTLIAGDAFSTLAGIVVSGKMNYLFPLTTMATWHKPTALASAQKLRALNPSRMGVGHGKLLANPLPDMDRAISDAAKAFEKI